jgi:hypothetical protein
MIFKVFESLAIISLTEKYPALSSTNIKHESNLLQIQSNLNVPRNFSRCYDRKRNLVYRTRRRRSKTGIGECEF